MLRGLAHLYFFLLTMRHHRVGCPTFRGFRKVGTTDLDSVFTRHIQMAGKIGDLAPGFPGLGRSLRKNRAALRASGPVLDILTGAAHNAGYLGVLPCGNS